MSDRAVNDHATLRLVERRGTAVALVVFAAVWVFAFAVHPDLLHPRLLGPEELIRRAHHDGLLQLAHALVTLDTALLVVLALHFKRLLADTSGAWAGSVGAALAVVGACLLAAEKGAMCLTVSALDTLPDSTFEQSVPGLVAVFSHKGWMLLTWGLVLMPLGVIVQTVAMMRARSLPGWQPALLLVSLLLICVPDGAEIVNLCAALAMTVALVPHAVALWKGGEGRQAPSGTTALVAGHQPRSRFS